MPMILPALLRSSRTTRLLALKASANTLSSGISPKRAAVAGSYHSAELNATFDMKLKDGKLWLTVPRFGEMPLDNVFADAFSSSSLVVRLERNKAGKIIGMVAYTGRANGMKLVRRG